MSLFYYLVIQQVVMSAIGVLGVQLLCEVIPRELKHTPIHYSSRLMGSALLVLPVTSFIYFFGNMYNNGAVWATAINLTAYCLTATLLSLAFYVLMESIKSRRILAIHLLIGALYPLPLWLTILFGSEELVKHAVIACYTLFCMLAVTHFVGCSIAYRRSLRESRMSGSIKNIKGLRLLGRVMNVSLALLVVSFCAPSFFSYPLWVGGVFVVLSVFAFIYIYVSYRKLLIYAINNYYNISLTLKDEDIDGAEKEEIVSADVLVLSDQTMVAIAKNLAAWLERKEYLAAEVSIVTVAKSIGTNRTYLSKYINAEYRCTFRAWLTALRIDEAKRMLIENQKLNVTQISLRVGFASTESFSHIFTRQTGMSPTRWREEGGN